MYNSKTEGKITLYNIVSVDGVTHGGDFLVVTLLLKLRSSNLDTHMLTWQ